MAGSENASIWSTNLAVLVMIMATAASAQAASFVRKWSPQARSDGLRAFGGAEDDNGNSDPRVKHMYV